MGQSAVSDRLDTYAKTLGGFRSYDFSQALAFQVSDPQSGGAEKTYKMVMRNGKPMGGLCATLCAFWAAFHSQQDAAKPTMFSKGRSLWDYLFDQNGLNMGAAVNITVEHRESSRNTAQIVSLENFLKKFQIVKRTKGVAGTALAETPVAISMSTVIRCAKHITEVNGYKLLSLKPGADGSGGGHMVCAFHDGSDVAFMDPNFGEFWFPNKAAFNAWFQFFWANTYVRSYKGLIVRTYSQAA